MNEILNTAITALVLLAGLAALIRYAAHDVFSGPFRTPGSGEAELDLRGVSRP